MSNRKRQPLATISNLAYPISAVFSWNPVKFVAMLALCVGSGAFHWTHKRIHRNMDEAGMYIAFLVYLAYEVMQAFPAVPAYFVLLPALAIAGFMSWRLRSIDSFKAIPLLFTLLMVATAIAEGWAGLYAGIPFVVGLGLNFAGRNYFAKFNVTNDFLHGCWHLLSAYGFYLI